MMNNAKSSDVVSLQQDVVEDATEGLLDVFYTNEKRDQLIHVRLNRSGLTLQKEVNKREKIIKMCDIVGGRCIMRIQKTHNLSTSCGCTSLSSCSVVSNTNKAASCARERELSAYFHVFAYVLKTNLRHVRRRERTVLTLRFCSFDTFEENMQEAERWNRTLYLYKNEALSLTSDSVLQHRRRRILLFLNPKSGSGKARRLFHLYVTPVFNEADLPYDLYVTKHINYARDFLRQRDLSAWSSVVAVGGGGLFFEIINGLLKRRDWKATIQRLSLGIIPCGASNGLAKSISYIYKEPYEPRPILGVTLTVVRGRTAPMDVIRLELRNQILYSCISVGWGLISDIDIESERLRSLGYQRLTLCSLHRLISLRTYRGRISYLAKNFADNVSSIGSNSNVSSKAVNTANNYQSKEKFYKSMECIHQFGKFDDISLETSLTRSFRSGLESWRSADSCESMYYSVAESVYHSIPSEKDACHDDISIVSNESDVSFGPIAADLTLNDPIPSIWTVEEGEFVMVQATYQTHLSSDCFFAPMSTLNDGTIYMIIIRSGISRTQLLHFLINMSSGTHIPTKKDSFIKIVAVSAFRIEPYETSGIMTVDGERIEFGPIHGAVMPGLVNVMVPDNC